MSTPVVTISEDADLDEIARIFQETRIKCAPVVRDGRIGGIVSRADLLRAITAQAPPPDAAI